MWNLNQARERIWQSIDEHGGATAVSNLTKPAEDKPPEVSASMLFKFRSPGGPHLGRDSVNALTPILTDIAAEVWLAAMGIARVEGQPEYAA